MIGHIHLPVVKPFLLAGIIMAIGIPSSSQVSDDEINLLKQLDSIQNSNSVSKYFGSLYFKTTADAVNFFLEKENKEREFIHRFEIRFAAFFLRSAEAYRSGNSIPAEWESYYTDSLSPLQYKLLGINAHINGDIWQALTTGFTPDEIRAGRKSYYKFEKSLIKIYRDFYNESFESNRKIRLMSSATGGLDKLYGKLMLGRWRKRQIELALLYFSNKPKFFIRLRKIHEKMNRINRLVIHNL
ncbi:MAG: hypothetical protein HZB42_14545 [Sphingobacteriales bacterium]|nr:hypothetical protein [Sphingobacteriales bacterium]